MSQIPKNYVSVALARLRRAVIGACILLAAALLMQTLIWALAMYTDVRYASDDSSEPAPTIVQGADRAKAGVRPAPAGVGSLRKPSAGSDASVETEARSHNSAQAEDGETYAPAGSSVTDAENGAKLSAIDGYFAHAMTMSAAIGTMAVLLLVPLIAVGVVLGAGSATPGVEKTVSAMTWTVVVGLLTLPLSSLFPMLGFEGALGAYASMTAAVEFARGDDIAATKQVIEDTAVSPTGARAGLLFYGRFFLLPMTCVVGTVLVGLKFSAGVEAAMIPLDFRLDPALEREASNVKAGTLHGGGRSAVALRGMLGPERRSSIEPDPAPVAEPHSATQLSPGSAPRRII